MAWLIIIVALWTYPIIAYFVLRLTTKNTRLRKNIFIVCAIAAALTTFSLLSNISTTLPELDWLVLTSLYFLLCIMFWWTQFQQNRFVKIIGIISMVIVFGLGYLSGTIGALGVGFVSAEYETDREIWLGDGFIYKESSLGNAVSDYRGKRVEIYKTLRWLPILEWPIKDTSYYNVITYLNPLKVEYKPNEKKVCLSTSMHSLKDERPYFWTDTLNLKKN